MKSRVDERLETKIKKFIDGIVDRVERKSNKKRFEMGGFFG